MQKKAKIVLAVALTVIAIVVILQNTEVVETHLLFMSFSMPRALLLVVNFLIGLGCGILLGGRIRRADKRAAKS